MSTSSATQSNWRQYGPVMLTRCPNCPRPEPLKRLVTKMDENGNLGREFVKCLSKPMAGRDGKILRKCTHFEWIDEYVQRSKSEGYIDSSMAATSELNLGGVPQMENWGSSDRGVGRAVPMARYLESELTDELKRIKKNQREMIDLQKQANIMAVFFYCCVIALFMFYLLFIVIRGGI
uniref:GRF-type domain-containing protein n=1 Tax=Hordeum vulgare subsp. vulgare TaxID=112509 RepID=A0A8I6X2H8_HORVV